MKKKIIVCLSALRGPYSIALAPCKLQKGNLFVCSMHHVALKWSTKEGPIPDVIILLKVIYLFTDYYFYLSVGAAIARDWQCLLPLSKIVSFLFRWVPIFYFQSFFLVIMQCNCYAFSYFTFLLLYSEHHSPCHMKLFHLQNATIK